MLDASRQSFPVSAAMCLLMAGVFVVRFMFAPGPAEWPFTEGMPIAAALAEFSIVNPRLALLCAAFFVGWTMLIVAKLASRYAPVASRNYLPAQVFLVGASGIVVSGEAIGAAICAWLLALAARQGVSSLHKGYRFIEVFRAGLYLGLLPLLYAPALVVAVVLAVGGLSIYRRSLREAVVCLVGFALPIPVAGSVHWALGSGPDFIYRELWRCVVVDNVSGLAALVPLHAVVLAGMLLLLACIGIFWALTHKRGMRKTPYKFMQYTGLALAVLVASVAIPGTTATLLPLVGVMAALSVPYAFSGKWKIVSTVVYWLMIIAVLTTDALLITGNHTL